MLIVELLEPECSEDADEGEHCNRVKESGELRHDNSMEADPRSRNQIFAGNLGDYLRALRVFTMRNPGSTPRAVARLSSTSKSTPVVSPFSMAAMVARRTSDWRDNSD